MIALYPHLYGYAFLAFIFVHNLKQIFLRLRKMRTKKYSAHFHFHVIV